MNQTEVALREVLASWESAVELRPSQAWARLLELVASGAARADRIARAGRTEPASTPARLRELLRAAGRGDLMNQIPEPDDRTKAMATRIPEIVA